MLNTDQEIHYFSHDHESFNDSTNDSVVLINSDGFGILPGTTAQGAGRSLQSKEPKGEGGWLRCMDDRAIH